MDEQLQEDVEQVDEVDKGFGSRMKAADAAANIYSKEKGKPDNREIDKIRAKHRAQKNKDEQIDELSKSTLGSYVKKASQSAADHGAEYGKKKADQDGVNRSLNRHGVSSQDKDDAHKAFKTTDADVSSPEKKASKRLKGINTAVKKLTKEEEVLEQKNCGCGQDPCKTYGKVEEKTLTPAEKKKREDVAKAIERDNPDMPMDKKMAIATATAKKVAEGIEDRHADAYDRVKKHLDQVKSSDHKAEFQKKFDTHLKSFDHHYEKDTGQEHHAVDDMHDLANDIKKHNTATAKKVAESSISDRTRRLIERAIKRNT